MALRFRLALAAVLTMAFLAGLLLLLDSPSVAGGGSGDSPPPTGDWDINQPTALWNETRAIQGSVNVNNGSLTLTNVTLYINGHLNVEAPTDLHGSTILVARQRNPSAGGVRVEDRLTLNRTALRLNLTANPTQDPEQQQIVVTGSGTMLVYNNSLISDGDNAEDDDSIAPGGNSNNYRLRFIVNNGARLEVYDSTISEIGWANPQNNPQDLTRCGLYINTPNVILHNTTVTKSWYGVYLRPDAANMHIDNSTLRDLEQHGVVTYGDDGVIENTTFSNGNIVLLAYYTSVRGIFKDNTVTKFAHGLQLNFADFYLVQQNAFSEITNRVFDVRADAVYNTFDNNTLSKAAYGLWTEGVRQTWGDRTYRYNPHHLAFTNNRLESVTTGINFDAGSTGDRQRSGGHNVTFDNNTFIGGTTAILVSQGGNRRLIDDFTLTHNNLTNSADMGIRLTQLYDSLVDNNTVRGGSIGVKLEASQGLRLVDNRLLESNFTGLYLTGSATDNEVANNTVIGSLGHGLYLRDSGANELHHNLITDFVGAGLWAEGSTADSVTNNTFYRGSEGFHLVGAAPNLADNALSDLEWAYYLLDITLPPPSDRLDNLSRGQLWQEYSLTVTVHDDGNNTKRNVLVEVYDVNETLVATDASGSDGTTEPFNLTHYQLDPQGARVDFTPHRAWAYWGTGSVRAAHNATAPHGRLTLQIDLVTPASWVVDQGPYVNQTPLKVQWAVLGNHDDVVYFHLEYREREALGPFTNWTLVGSFATNSTWFNVTDGLTYQLRTRAEDDFGNLEQGGSQWQFTTDLTAPASLLSSPYVADGNQTSRTLVLLDWGPAPDVSDADRYTLSYRSRSYPGGEFGSWQVYPGLEETTIRTLEFTARGGFEYQFKIRTRDPAGNWEVKADPDLTFSVDTTPPQAWLEPLEPLTSGDRLTLHIGFPASSDLALATLQYLKYKETDPPAGSWLTLGTYNRSVLEQTDITFPQLESGSVYLFRLLARDGLGNEGPRQQVEVYYVGNGTANQTYRLPLLPLPAGTGLTNDRVVVQAYDELLQDYGPGLTQDSRWPSPGPGTYYLEEGTGTLRFGDGRSGFRPGQNQSLRITFEAFDTLTLVDFTPPLSPGDPSSVSPSNTSVSLTWKISASPDVTTYRLETLRNGSWEAVAQLDPPVDSGYLNYLVTGLNRSLHSFRVVAIDRVALESIPSGEVLVDLTPPPIAGPSAPTGEGLPSWVGLITLLLAGVGGGGLALYLGLGRRRSSRSKPPVIGPPSAPPQLEPVAPVAPVAPLAQAVVVPAYADPLQEFAPPERRRAAADPPAFEELEGELVCQACGATCPPPADRQEVVCEACGNMGPSRPSD